MKLPKIFILILLSILLKSCVEINNELCVAPQKFETNYSNFEGIEVYNNIEDAINCSSKSSKPVFVLFAGYGSSYSKETFQQKLFKSRRFRKLIADHFIPAVLYVDDRTKLKEIQISVRNGIEHKLRNIGNLNADYQIRKLKKNSQPHLVILDHNGRQVISQMGYNKDSSKYYHFLKDGLKMYEDGQVNNK